MAKVTAICGRICSGTTSYAHRLREKTGAVLLSVDEVMLAIFGQDAGEMHDTYASRAQRYLLSKAAEIVSGGVDVLIDWGLWTAEERRAVREFFSRLGVAFELYYIDIDENEWRARIESRNLAVMKGEADAYYIDEGLARKFASRFELPSRDELDGVIPACDT